MSFHKAVVIRTVGNTGLHMLFTLSVCARLADQSCLTLHDPTDCRPPGSSVSLSNVANQEEIFTLYVRTIVSRQSKVLGNLRDCSLLTPLLVGAECRCVGLSKDIVPRFPPKDTLTRETFILTISNVSPLILPFPSDMYYFPFSIHP